MKNQNSYLGFKNYFEQIVAQSTFLKGFVGFSEREWNSKKSRMAGLATPTLALFHYQNSFDAPETKASSICKVGFAIMLSVKKPDDFAAQYEAIDTAEQHALKVISRITHDSSLPQHFLYNTIVKSSIVINPVELSGNDFGVEVFLNFKIPQSFKVNQNDWKDELLIC